MSLQLLFKITVARSYAMASRHDPSCCTLNKNNLLLVCCETIIVNMEKRYKLFTFSEFSVSRLLTSKNFGVVSVVCSV